MRYLFSCLFILALTIGFSTNEASARGFGGRGFSMPRSNHAFSSFARPKQNTLFSKRGVNKRRSFLPGLLMGGLLASLFMGHGLGGALLSWMLLGVFIYLIVSLVRRKRCDHHCDHHH